MSNDDEKAVDLFFDAVGISPRTGSLARTGEVAEAFARLPYENISKILKTTGPGTPAEWRRQPLEVMQDHIQHGLGGTCYSLTWFLMQVLARIGVAVQPVLADMPSGVDHHCGVILQQDGADYLIDPGYLICKPVRLTDGESRIRTPRGDLLLRYNRENRDYHLVSVEEAGERFRYRLKPSPVNDVIFVDRWVDSFSWPQMNQLLATRYVDDHQVYLHNRHLRVIRTDEIEKSNLKVGLEQEVQRLFGIDADKLGIARRILNDRRPKKKI